MDRGSNEARSLYLTGVCGVAFLLGLAPIVNLLFSVIGLMFVIAAFLGSLFLLFIRLRQGRSPAVALLELSLIGVFSFFAIYGTMWYFISYMPSQGAAMFTFHPAGSTPTK